ncbi:hypothetical protein CH260_12730 [Rhodococcus sp. 05-2256-B2]|uniref:terminase large subunit domain-containing protein n=1 Tax=unclassified Rhodococcus (in: high G+C Gram-positive bacteria) TaxID=192944 RepID=UPI000B9B0796|nr:MULTISPECIES: terminase large subunit [unclassified Rhodococcus (in: high G+C Gram-positive bacteria)]OZD82917.1 hypothetical protein CH258_18235 [Rhodococcus sp. 05-2256-B4]OZD96176.1 hypothetical protein CH260_12730 [Rhodococcus sp. 05-2256-B2]OZD96598.1 hypothetical protein CH257_04890 [Rhodococcus sp. 05-2256-B3]OZD99574.1 hypothetical protein CH285_20840 [Rhodococcus sp. 05-2256-B1]
MSLIEDARDDIDIFARELAGRPLWPHQLEVAYNPARIRIMCCGRQAGKSSSVQMIALHTAFAAPNKQILILSATQDTASDLLREISRLIAGSRWFAGSVVEDLNERIVLTNGSEIRCVSASEKQIRGKSIDLLILDEANQMPKNLWKAAAFTVIARPGSRVILASTPSFREHFFRDLFVKGQEHTGMHASFRWPSTISPIMDTEMLAALKSGMTEREIAQEVEAQWVDDAGAFFSEQEILDAVVPYHLTKPEDAQRQLVAGGIDWGYANDANALALIGVLDDSNPAIANDDHALTYFVPWIESHSQMRAPAFIDRILDVAKGYNVNRLISETNGIGQFPTQDLADKFHVAYRSGTLRNRTPVHPIATTSARKQSGFNQLKLMMNDGRLILSTETPALLTQLRNLEYTTSETGNVRIAVPERRGHDDEAMALMQAMSTINRGFRGYRHQPTAWDRAHNPQPDLNTLLTTPLGTKTPPTPTTWDIQAAFRHPRGTKHEDAGW